MVVGSINVDLVCVVPRLPRAGETVAGGHFARHGGGKSANQAVAAARLGAPVVFVGAVGRDDLGEDAVSALAAEGIDVSGVARVDAPTGVALIMVDEAGENQIAVASGANAELVVDSLDLAGAGVVLLCHEVSPTVVASAAALAEEAGWPVVLNPAPARELPSARLSVLTPNASEAEELTGCADPAQAAARLVSDTGAAVLITLGRRGRAAARAGRLGRAPAGLGGRRRRHHRRGRHRQRRTGSRVGARAVRCARPLVRAGRGGVVDAPRGRAGRHADASGSRGRAVTLAAPPSHAEAA